MTTDQLIARLEEAIEKGAHKTVLLEQLGALSTHFGHYIRSPWVAEIEEGQDLIRHLNKLIQVRQHRDSSDIDAFLVAGYLIGVMDQLYDAFERGLSTEAWEEAQKRPAKGILAYLRTHGHGKPKFVRGSYVAADLNLHWSDLIEHLKRMRTSKLLTFRESQGDLLIHLDTEGEKVLAHPEGPPKKQPVAAASQ